MSARYDKQERSRIRDFVILQLVDYPTSRRQLAEYKEGLLPSPVPRYGSAGGTHGGESRPTEQLAVRIASDSYLAHLERAVTAIERVLVRLDDTDRKLIRVAYWRRGGTVTKAAAAAYVSKSEAYRRLSRITVAIARELGYML